MVSTQWRNQYVGRQSCQELASDASTLGANCGKSGEVVSGRGFAGVTRPYPGILPVDSACDITSGIRGVLQL